MKELNIDAEMGLDAYGPSTPGEWILEMLNRLRNSARWDASEIDVGVEDDSESGRTSLAGGEDMDSAFMMLVLASQQCSCFLTVNDSEASWSLPLLLTKEGEKTTLTASVYDVDLRSGISIWSRIDSLLDVCFDILLVEGVEWLRFGIEGEGITSLDSSIFVVLSERAWMTVAEETRCSLSNVVDERLNSRIVWFSPPPGMDVPGDYEAHLTAVSAAIMAG